MGVPTLTALVSGEDKMIMYRVLVSAITTTTVAYLILGISCVMFFGREDTAAHQGIQKIISLNWIEYTGNKMATNPSFFASIISYFIRLYQPFYTFLTHYSFKLYNFTKSP